MQSRGKKESGPGSILSVESNQNIESKIAFLLQGINAPRSYFGSGSAPDPVGGELTALLDLRGLLVRGG